MTDNDLAAIRTHVSQHAGADNRRAAWTIVTTVLAQVGVLLLYAASRFNAHVVSQHAESVQNYERDLPKAKKYFVGQYKEMLDENLEDYKEVYSKYANLVRKQ